MEVTFSLHPMKIVGYFRSCSKCENVQDAGHAGIHKPILPVVVTFCLFCFFYFREITQMIDLTSPLYVTCTFGI